MSLTAEEFDVKRYGRLLARAVPRVIRTEVENERALAVVESLMAKGEDHRTAEEDALLELLADLIHSYEKSAYPVPQSEPHEMVAFLLDQRGLTAQDLVPVVGSRSRVSEILAAKRSISKEQAKKLAAFFKVGLEAFI
jgi:HTH-type transcriptional regulator/antitoxin HigA